MCLTVAFPLGLSEAIHIFVRPLSNEEARSFGWV